MERGRKDTIMTATKAIAGGVAANIITVILWAMSSIPGWDLVPEQPKAAIIALVSTGVGAAIVYFAPANEQTFTATVAERGSEVGASFRSDRVLAG